MRRGSWEPERLGHFHSFRLVLGEVGRGLAAYCGESVYLDVALTWVVSRTAVCPVAMREERGRPSGYSTRQLASHFWRMVLTSGTRPLRLVALFGLVLGLAAFVLMGWVVWAGVTDEVPVQGWTSVMVILLAVGGGTLLSLGIVAEYLGIAARSAMGKPLYLVVSDPPTGPLGRARQPAARPSSRRREPDRPSRAVGDARPLAWVVGRGGLLGRHVEAALGERAELWRPSGPISWDEASAAADALSTREIDAFLDRARRARRAVAAVLVRRRGRRRDVARGARAGDARRRRFLSTPGGAARRRSGARPARHAVLRLVGGRRLRGSPARPPFDEDSPVRALAPYGHEKLAQEELFAARRGRVRRRSLDRPALEPLRARAEPRRSRRASSPTSGVPRCGASRCRSTSRSTRSATTSSPRTPAAWWSPRSSGARKRGAGATAAATVTKIFASEVETTVASVLGTWRRSAAAAAARRAREQPGRPPPAADAVVPLACLARPARRADAAPPRRRRRAPRSARAAAGGGARLSPEVTSVLSGPV